MKKNPYKWQKEAIKDKRYEEFFMLDCSCGLGKTYTFIEIVKMNQNSKIIIAPKNLGRQWKNDLMEEGVNEKDIWVHRQTEMTKNPERYQRDFVTWAKIKGRYLIVPTQNFSLSVKGHKVKDASLLPFVVRIMLGLYKKDLYAVLDESSWIKANSPNRKQLSARNRMIVLLGSLVGNRAAGSGTVITKTPMNIYHQYEFLKPGFWGESENEFFERYTITKKYYYNKKTPVTAISKEDYFEIQNYLRNPQWGLSMYTGKDRDRDEAKITKMSIKHKISMNDVMLITKSDRYWPYRNLDELMERVACYTVRVRREDVFDIKHDKFIYDPIVRSVPLTTEQRKLYDKLVEDGFSESFYLGKAQALELGIRLQDICIGYEPLKDKKGAVSYKKFKENPKLEELLELLDEIDEAEQVIIWCSRRAAVESVAEALEAEDISFVIYTGDQNEKEKTEAEEIFASKKARVFVGNIAAGSFGLNSLADCNYMIWYCIDDSPERYHQAQHRPLRKESKNPKFAYVLLCEGTMEERQFANIKNGEEFIKFKNKKEDFAYAERRGKKS